MKQIAVTLALVGASTIGLANTSHAITLPTPSALKEAVPSRRPKSSGGVAAGAAEGGAQELALELRPVRSRRLPWPARLTGAAADTGAVIPATRYAPAYGYGMRRRPHTPTRHQSLWIRTRPPIPITPMASPAYAYSYGTRYVSPRARYAYGGVAPRLRYANTSAYGVRTYSSGPRYRAIGSRSTVRVVNRHR